MPGPSYFVILAEMRTGSNLLEANLAALDGVRCYGEAFNPYFVQGPKVDALFGFDLAKRDKDPFALLLEIKSSAPMAGFRLFHDHDARIIDHVLRDPECAKIVLKRNPLESYVSWKIAQKTGQWKLTNAKHQKAVQIAFDGTEFAGMLGALQEHQVRILKTLQHTGQTAFYLDYKDLLDVDTINGLAAYLGVEARLASLDKTLKKQNPEPLRAKISNYEAVAPALAEIDFFDIAHTPDFEPRRAPAVPTYMAAPKIPLLFSPVAGGPTDRIAPWMAAMAGVSEAEMHKGFKQKELRAWIKSTGKHRRFTVVRHPLVRAHAVFCDKILSEEPGAFHAIRETLRKVYKLPIPPEGQLGDMRLDQYRAAFEGFLTFLRRNLNGQTAIRVDAHWASQSNVIQGFSQFAPMDVVLREDTLKAGLERMCDDLEIKAQPVSAGALDVPFALKDIYDQSLEDAARAAYTKDYQLFGFDDWSAT